MGRIVELFHGFPGGMKRDVDRTNMPQGTAWDLRDYFPERYGAPLRKRAGWDFAVTAATFSSSLKAYGIAYDEYSGYTVFVDQIGSIWTMSSSTYDNQAATASLTAYIPAQNPVYWRTNIIVPGSNGTAGPKQVSAAVVSDLSGSPPPGRRATVYKDRFVLANSSANGDRIWFSAAGDSGTWDTTNGYITSIGDVKGLMGLTTVMIIFHATFITKVRGSVPPPGGDFQFEYLSKDVGCDQPFSIVAWKDICYFANSFGVFRTDGGIVEDLTKDYGIKSLWITECDAVAPALIAGGIWDGLYIVTIRGATGTFRSCFVFDTELRIAYRLTNFQFGAFTYALHRNRFDLLAAPGLSGTAGRLMRLSTMAVDIGSSSDFKNDDNGTAVTPQLDTPYYNFGSWIDKSIDQIYPTYDLRDQASDNPTLTVAYTSDPSAESYTSISSTLAETSAPDRVRRNIRLPVKGISFRISQTNASQDTRIYGMEAEVDPREDTRI